MAGLTGIPDPGVVDLVGAFPIGDDRLRIVFSDAPASSGSVRGDR